MRGFVIPWKPKPGGPPTEAVLCNAATISSGSAVGGSVPTILADADDLTYVNGGIGTVVTVTGIGYADLVNHNGRTISSFTVTARMTGTISGTVDCDTFSGVTVASNGQATYGTLGDLTIGPFTKSGGGDWSVAEINSLTHRLTTQSPGTKRIIETTLTVTYA